MLYRSKPSDVEAIQWTGDFLLVQEFAPSKVDLRGDILYMLTGKDGAQEWVPVPVGHWLVHPPGDLSDIWPVENDYFQAKYEAVQ